MSMHNGFASARQDDLLVEQVGAETVVYDGRSSKAHCLSPVAAVVFARADGRSSPADLAAIASSQLAEPVDVQLVEQALAELEELDLLVAPAGSGISRRQLVRRTAVVGGAIWATPLVLTGPAFGQNYGSCTCPAGRLFKLKTEGNCNCAASNDDNDCIDPNPTLGAAGCCLIPSLITVDCSTDYTHEYTLQPGVELCAAGGKGGNACDGTTITETANNDGTTTVTIFNPPPQELSHTDIVVCVTGSLPPSCVDD
jgi:hypothetical protein